MPEENVIVINKLIQEIADKTYSNAVLAARVDLLTKENAELKAVSSTKEDK